jgi:uncharacterized protein (TIGR03437 family)
MSYPMARPLLAAILLLILNFSYPRSGAAAPRRSPTDAAGVFGQLNLALFGGSGQNSIQAMSTDPSGNIYVVGTTSSPDFPVHNALQPNFAEAQILRTIDLGNTWTRVSSPADVTTVFPDPVAPQVLFAGGTAGIYKTSDGGQTWSVVYPLQPATLNSLVIDPGNHLRIAAIVFTVGLTLIRSLDGGVTWTSVTPTSNYAAQLVADPGGSGALVQTGAGIFLSRDWGLTFTQLNPPGIGTPSTVAFDPSHPGWIYVELMRGATGSLVLTTDFGTTWTTKASPPTTFDIQNLAVDTNTATTLLAATADGLYKSTDSAASWSRVNPSLFNVEGHFPFVLMNQQCAPPGGLFAIGSGIGYYSVAFSPDYGNTWKPAQLSHVTGVAAGGACAVYVTRTMTSDAFLAKLLPTGEMIWSTYLGGSDQDAAVGLAVDSQGNVYVAGNTSSGDFPISAPRIGVSGQNSVFLTKLLADGTLGYSVLIGGEANNTATSIAVDASQNVYVAGSTNSMNFPVTPGTLATSLDAGSYTGFIVKLSPIGSQIYGTFLSNSYTQPNTILVGADDEPVLAGLGQLQGLPPPQQGSPSEFLMKLDRSASQILLETYLQGAIVGAGPTSLASDGSDNLLVTGGVPDSTAFTVTPGAYKSPPSQSGCGNAFYYRQASSSVYVVKLRAADWQTMYAALVTAPCGMVPSSSMVVDNTGAVVVGISTGAGLPLHNPLLAGPTCAYNSSALAKLSPDGSTLQFATYLDSCGVPPLALARDGSVYAGAALETSAAVLHLASNSAPAISLDGISNAFSGDGNAVVGGGLYSLTATGFQPPSINLGFSPTQSLPTQLGGVKVMFDGIAGAMLQTGPGRAMVVPPWKLSRPQNVSAAGNQRFHLTKVEIAYDVAISNAVWMPVLTSLPELLTASFPSPQAGPSDANARNADGTPNDVNHPAAAGSTITLFATGLGDTKPMVAFNSVANSNVVVPVQPIYSTWTPKSINGPGPPTPVYSVPGFISAMFQIAVQVPNPLPGGTDVGNSVHQVPIALLLGPPPLSSITVPVSNVVNVYLK